MELIQHYSSEKFGFPNIGPSNEGVRILDLIRSLMAGPGGYPLAPAADEVLGKLEALGDGLELFRADASGWAQPSNLSRLETVVTGTRTIDPFFDAGLRHHQARVQGRDYGKSWEEFIPSKPRTVNETAVVQTPWLETLRCELVQKGNRKALDRPELVRLVIRRDRANELFGCGPVLSWWEEQPQAVPVNGPGNYPPPELHGIRAHDANTWGAQLTGESPPRAVVRIADLVQYVADRMGLPAVRDIAGQVLGAIAAGAPGLYLLNQGSKASPLDPAHLWRRAFVSGIEHQAETRRQIQSMPGLVDVWPVEPDEADARGLPTDDGTRTKCGHAGYQLDWPAMPELRGAAGAMQLARLHWVERARTFADLDAGDLGRLAVPLAWAVAKFGKPVQAAEPAAADAPAVECVLTAPTLAPVPVILPVAKRTAAEREARMKDAADRFKRAKDPDEKWTAQHRGELLRQFEFLTASGAGKLKAEDAHGWLADLWGLEPNSIRAYVSKARGELHSKPARYG